MNQGPDFYLIKEIYLSTGIEASSSGLQPVGHQVPNRQHQQPAATRAGPDHLQDVSASLAAPPDDAGGHRGQQHASTGGRRGPWTCGE